MPYICRHFNIGCTCIYNFHFLLFNWLLYHYIMTFLVSFYCLCFKIYFIWYKCEYYCLFYFPLAWNIFCCPSLLVYVCLLGLKLVSFKKHILEFCCFIYSLYLVFVEGVALQVQSRHSTAWATPAVHFAVVILKMGVSHLHRLALNRDPLILSLPSS
jgi:hypothetical protein